MPVAEDSMTTPPRPPPSGDGAPPAPGRLPPKKDVATALLAGPSLFVHLDPRKADVVVPPYFKKQPQLVLQVGLNMPVPIPDLVLDDDAMTCTLSFNRSPFWCRIPWASVYALVGEDGKGMVWPGDVPSEVVARMQRETAPAERQRSAPKKRPKRAAARPAAPPAAEKPRPAAEKPRPAAEKPRPAAEKRPAQPTRKGKRELPPYLRVVK
jgi:stringent starvation protein B